MTGKKQPVKDEKRKNGTFYSFLFFTKTNIKKRPRAVGSLYSQKQKLLQ